MLERAWPAGDPGSITPSGHDPTPSQERAMADALRAAALGLAPDAGLAVAMADAATVLWTLFHRFDAADPCWPDRDRFVLSPGYGAPLLYALLQLTGHEGVDSAVLRSAHPDRLLHPAIEATTGPLGEGLGMAVGMALAERLMAARFGRSLVDHRTWVIATVGDLMEGLSHEAASLAGHLRLEKLLVLLEDDMDHPDCCSGLAGPSDPIRRFAALGWATRTVDAHDPVALASALSLAARAKRPTLIACRTSLDAWRPSPVAPATLAEWRRAGTSGVAQRRAWLKRLAHHPQRSEFERVVSGRLPEGWAEGLAALKQHLAAKRQPRSTRDAAEEMLETLAPGVPELVGGQTALRPGRGKPVQPGSFSGRQVHYGPREHGMAATVNGLALHGGLLPYAVSTLLGTDAMRPSLRLAAMMGLRTVFVATHDSITGAPEGPAYQPIEQLAGLRAMPNLLVLRPADAVETAECIELAVRRSEGPSLLVLSEQSLPALRGDAGENRCARGGYVLAEANGPRAATLIATGSEVSLALAARDILAGEGIAAAVVSLPVFGLFARMSPAERLGVLGTAPRFGIEAGTSFGWGRWLGEGGTFLGIEVFGGGEALGGEAPLTPEGVACVVRRRVATEPVLIRG
jgi:transketolase